MNDLTAWAARVLTGTGIDPTTITDLAHTDHPDNTVAAALRDGWAAAQEAHDDDR